MIIEKTKNCLDITIKTRVIVWEYNTNLRFVLKPYFYQIYVTN